MKQLILFNDWIRGTNHADPGFNTLGDMWIPDKGRVTRKIVEKRATEKYFLPPGVGAAAWDLYASLHLHTPKTSAAYPPSEDTQPSTKE